MISRKVDELMKMVSESEKLKEGLNKKVSDQQSELSDLRSRYEELVTCYKDKVEETEKELSTNCNTLKEKNLMIVKLENDLQCAKDQIILLEKSLGDYLDENMKYKNENKVIQRKLKDTKDGNMEQMTNNEIHQIKQELGKLKSHVSKELSELKVKVSSINASTSRQLMSSCTLETVNRFKPLQFSTNNEEKEESSTQGSSDEGDADDPPTPRTASRRRRKRSKKLKVVPGIISYSQAIAGMKKNIVFSSSLTRDIEVNDFNRSSKEGNSTQFVRFRGKKIKHIKHYIQTHLDEVQPDRVIIVGGGNDLPVTQLKESPVNRVANDIIEAGRVCEQNGVTKVAISSIPPRQSFHFQLYRKELNDKLRVLCESNGFDFIDNSNIILRDHILRDGVHLNQYGNELLRRNLLTYFNNLP